MSVFITRPQAEKLMYPFGAKKLPTEDKNVVLAPPIYLAVVGIYSGILSKVSKDIFKYKSLEQVAISRHEDEKRVKGLADDGK